MEQLIKLELAVNEINTLLAGLAKLPYEISADLIVNIRTQSIPQLSSEGVETTG